MLTFQTAPQVPPLMHSVDGVSLRRRVDAWADIINDTFYALDLSSPSAEFKRADLKIFDVSDIRFSHMHCDATICVRKSVHTIDNGDFYFLPIAIDDPIFLSQGNQETSRVNPGDLCVISTFRPYKYEQFTENRSVTLRIHGSKLRRRLPNVEDLVGRGFSNQRPAVRLFVDMARSFAINGTELDHRSAARVTDCLMDLLALALEAPESAHQSSESAVCVAHRARIQRVIERRLTDAGLTPSEVCKEVGLSIRYVQKLLADRGESLAELIRQQRIALACRRLSDPSWAHHSIATISYGLGYEDPAYFTRVFRQEKNQSPRDFRAAAKSSSESRR